MEDVANRHNFYSNFKAKENGRAASNVLGSRKCLGSRDNSSEIRGLLGFRPPSHGGIYAPLVETASSLINNLQAASSSEDFVNGRQLRAVSKCRNGIVFTGFRKEKEREFRLALDTLGLKMQPKVTDRTYCVVSAHGERTLNTMRAIVTCTPVVKPDWVNACLKENSFLSLDNFGYDRWQQLIQKRGKDCRLFSGFGKIFICNGCSPPNEELQWIIKQSGGEVTTDLSRSVLVVAPCNRSLEISCSEDLEPTPPVVVERYILDCVTENMILAVDDYVEHDVVDRLC